ncbi:MAG: YraN family protein [Chloroflexota bacterium]
MTKIALGKQGEQIAAAYLEGQGYTLIEANWHAPQGEFDLIMREGDTLVFVEVKTRKAGIEAAFESISPRKKRILEQLVYHYLTEKQVDSDWRIDVIAVTLAPKGQPVIEHVQDAFDW